MTAFRREARYHQARWREANRHPIGTQPIVPRPGDTGPAGGQPAAARLRPRHRRELRHARRVGCRPRPHRVSSSRVKASTTSGCGPTCCRRRRCRSTCSATSPPTSLGPIVPCTAGFPTRPAVSSELRFAHSPGWFDPAYLNSLRSFDAVFILDLDDGSRGIVAVDVKLPRAQQEPRPPDPRTSTATARSRSARRCSHRARSPR